MSGNVYITVVGVNDAIEPAADDDYTSDEAPIFGNVVVNDGADPDGDVKVVINQSGDAAYGAFTLDSAGDFSYYPSDSLEEGVQYQETIDYVVTDARGTYVTANINVTITGVNDPPVAVDDGTFVTDEDTSYEPIEVLDNDQDPDSDPEDLWLHSFDPFSDEGAAISLSSLEPNSLNYDPLPSISLNKLGIGDSKGDSFNYKVADEHSATNSGTVTSLVHGANDPPVAAPDAYTISANQLLDIPPIGVLANDPDPDDDPLIEDEGEEPIVIGWPAESLSEAPISGQTDGAFTYDPRLIPSFQELPSGVSATDSFVYTIADPHSATSTATVTITVIGVNDAPVGVPDNYGGSIEETLNVAAPGLLANDTDIDTPLNELTIADTTPVDSRLGATVTFMADGSFVYDPLTIEPADLDGDPDSFQYFLSDGTDTATGTASISLDYDYPIAGDDAFSTGEDEVYASGLNLTDNDYEPPQGIEIETGVVVSDLDALVSISADGTFSYDPSNAEPIQQLNAGEFASESFDYLIEDPQGVMDTGSVAVWITGANDVPNANPDSHSIDEDTTLSLNAADGLLSNDDDLDLGDTLSLINVGASAYGSAISYSSNGSLTYDPASSAAIQSLQVGGQLTDVISYTIVDGSGATDTTSVSIAVDGMNDAPEASEVPLIAAAKNASPVSLDVGSYFFDVDQGDSFTLSVHDNSNAALVTEQLTGSILDLTFAADSIGDATITLRATDSQGAFTDAAVDVVVYEDADADEPSVFPNSYEGPRNLPISVTPLHGLLTNDFSFTGSELRAALAAAPSHGSAAVLADGSFEYVPDVDFEGTDTFTYVAIDESFEAAISTATIVVTNHTPSAREDEFSVRPLATLSVNAASGLLANDSDLDGDELTVSEYSAPDYGTLTFVNADGSFEYVPPSGYEGVATFTYRATDGVPDSESDLTQVTINVSPNPPVAVDDSQVVSHGADWTFIPADLDQNDLTGDGSLVSTAIDTPSALGGTITDNGDGTYTLSPDSDAQDSATFSYTITDDFGYSSTADVTVTYVNNQPVGVVS